MRHGVRGAAAWAAGVLAVLGAWVSGQQLSMRHVSVPQGLAQSQVWVINQDALGYLWVGTHGGLSRHDGRRFLTLTKEDGLADDFVWSLAPAPDGGVWVGTDTGGVARWDRDGLSHPLAGRGLPSSRVRGLLLDAAGDLWIGFKEGLFRSRRSDCALAAPVAVDALFAAPAGQVAILSGGGVWRIRDGRLGEVGIRPADQAGRVAAAAYGPDGSLWAASESGGLWRRGPDGRCEAVAAAGVLPRPRALRVTRGGEVWVGTSQGLFALAGGQMVRQQLRPAATDDVRALFEDREGNLWVGTNGDGLFQAVRGAFRVFTADTGLPTPLVLNFTETPDGRIWMATLGGGIATWRDGQWGRRFTAADGLPGDRVICLAADGDDVWAGTSEGLARIDGRRGRVQTWRAGQGIPHNSIASILKVRDGAVWVATVGGLSRFRDGSWRTWQAADGLPGQQVMGLAEDGQGAVWLATYGGGVVRFDGAVFQQWTAREGLPDDRVWCVRVDSLGRVWAGTDTGVWVHPLDGSGNFSVTTRGGLPSKSVWFLVEDREGRVWAGTTRGVALVSRDGRVEHVYTDASGLSHIEAAQNAAFRDSRGRLWLGMTNGVTLADPGSLKPNRLPPTLVLERMLVNERPLDAVRMLDAAGCSRMPRLQLEPDENDLGFVFTGLSLTWPERVRFRWQLQHLDRGWTAPRAESEAVYRRVPPGDYTFMLQAQNSDGVWSPAPLRLALRIRPPWYTTAWFRLLVLALVAAGSASIVGLRAQAERRRRRELEQVVADRTAELAHANQVISKQNARLEEMVRTDPLTGLANRRALAETLPEEITHIQRVIRTAEGGSESRSLAVYMLDIDHFKQVNDTFGHETGDALLEGVAAALKGVVRGVDLVVRWGGEEILVVARDVKNNGLKGVAAKLMRTVAGVTVPGRRGEAVRVTASVGFCPYPLGQTDGLLREQWNRIVDLADALLYLAKRNGRARACGLVRRGDSIPRYSEQDILRALLQDPRQTPPSLEFVELDADSAE
jgi:diguanylate cyclase (GGDEF)-like protein